jgi:hypothetical protein
MKTDTSMNLMLVVFCVVLIGFVLLNRKMSESLNHSQAQTEHTTHVNND